MIADDNGRMSTIDAITKLLASDNPESFIAKNNIMEQIPSLSHYISEMCDLKEISIAKLFFEADIEKSHGYQIIKGRRRLSRDNALKIAFVLNLSVQETQRLLTLSMNSHLYPFVPRDAAILFYLNNGVNYMDAQINLDDLGMTVLGD